MDVDTVKKGSKDGKTTKVCKLAMSFEEARKKGLCAGCGGKGHITKECPNKKSSGTSSSGKSTEAQADSSSKASSSKGKEKDKGQRHTRHSVREVYGSDSERFQELDTEDSSSESSEEEAPKPKQKKSSSKGKMQKVNRVVFSDDEDFLQGPM